MPKEKLVMTTTKPRILVVDDNPINLAIMKEALADRFDLLCVASGRQALAATRTFNPDVVLLDVMMPEMDGLETCRQLRSQLGVLETTILMVSAKAFPEEQSAGLRAGANGYLVKPFEEYDLIAAIDSQLAKRKSLAVRI